jgi:hypothetical protein
MPKVGSRRLPPRRALRTVLPLSLSTPGLRRLNGRRAGAGPCRWRAATVRHPSGAAWPATLLLPARLRPPTPPGTHPCPSLPARLAPPQLEALNMDPAFLNRNVNEGFSGGEKKRNEILQLACLEADMAILDEIDSGGRVGAQGEARGGLGLKGKPGRAGGREDTAGACCASRAPAGGGSRGGKEPMALDAADGWLATRAEVPRLAGWVGRPRRRAVQPCLATAPPVHGGQRC